MMNRSGISPRSASKSSPVKLKGSDSFEGLRSFDLDGSEVSSNGMARGFFDGGEEEEEGEWHDATHGRGYRGYEKVVQ